jgi:hypothetical protein
MFTNVNWVGTQGTVGKSPLAHAVLAGLAVEHFDGDLRAVWSRDRSFYTGVSARPTPDSFEAERNSRSVAASQE